MIISSEDHVLLTVEEASSILRVSNTTILNYIHRKKNPLKASSLKGNNNKSKYNRQPWRIRYRDLQEFINNGASKKQKQERTGNESDE